MTNHSNRPETIRPWGHLQAASKIYPGAWKQYEKFRADREGLGGWPNWCYCPMAAAYAIVSNGGMLDPSLIGDVAKLSALAAWRTSQVIYRFDPALSAALVDTPLNKLPTEALYRLPLWGVYIESPNIAWFDDSIHGFFAHLEHDARNGRNELRLLYDTKESLIAQPLHIDHETITAAVDATLNETRRQMINQRKTLLSSILPDSLKADLVKVCRPAISLLLYLCSESADVDIALSKPQPKKTKRGWKIFPPNTPQVVNVGSRIGTALRAAYQDEQTGTHHHQDGRQSPRPHIRRAHYHTYRAGKGRTEIRIKWLPPMPINIDHGDMPITINKINGEH